MGIRIVRERFPGQPYAFQDNFQVRQQEVEGGGVAILMVPTVRMFPYKAPQAVVFLLLRRLRVICHPSTSDATSR